MIHYARVRIAGICKCKLGGDVEVALTEGGSYWECVYCKQYYRITDEKAVELILKALKKRQANPPASRKVVKPAPIKPEHDLPVFKKKKKKLKKVKKAAAVPVPTKKKKKKRRIV